VPTLLRAAIGCGVLLSISIGALADTRTSPAPAIAVTAVAAVLAKIKADFPDASILKLDRRTADLEGEQLTYEVKLLTADGRIARLTYNAASAALIEQAGMSRGGQAPQRHRERRRGR
jgi:hypothetical protein